MLHPSRLTLMISNISRTMADISKKLDVVVVGGSLAGLMCSIPLLRLGHNVTILERSPTPLLHDQGAGIVAGNETQAFFSKHDRTQRPLAVTSMQRLYLNKGGDVIDRDPWEQRMTSWDLAYYLGRANFDGVESKYVPNKSAWKKLEGEGTARYEYGRSVTGVEEVGEMVEISYESTRRDGKDATIDEDKKCSFQADILIAAEGPSSNLRKQLLPHAPSRTHTGYVAFRGTCPEYEVSSSGSDVFVERFTFFHSAGTQILAYTIPGPSGALEKGKRLVNWVWYCNYEEDSKEYKELMTDVDGQTHKWTLPTGGKMRSEVWERQMERAREILPPQFAEIVTKTKTPFVQAIADLLPPEKNSKFSRLLGGKVILVGDALCGFRPHTAASTSQAAFHALQLERVFGGTLSWDDYENDAYEFARYWSDRGIKLGERSQHGRHPLAS